MHLPVIIVTFPIYHWSPAKTSVTSPAAKSEEKRMFSRAIYMEVYKKSFCVIRQVRTDIAKEFSEFSLTVCFKLRRQV